MEKNWTPPLTELALPCHFCPDFQLLLFMCLCFHFSLHYRATSWNLETLGSQCIIKVYFCENNKLLPSGHGIIPSWWVSSFYAQSLLKNRQMATDTCLARRWQFLTMAFISCVGSSVCLFRILNCQNRNHKLFQQYLVQNNEHPLVTEAFGYHHNKYLPKQEQRFILFPKQQQEALAFGYPGYPFGI